MVKLAEDKYLALWEKWTEDKYESTYYIIFNSEGKIIKNATMLGQFRINKGDDVIEWNGKALWVIGQRDFKTLKIHILSPE